MDHYTYVMCGDGDLMEGVSHEAASLAGTLGLGKMIYFYDDNLISLDGPTELSFTEDVTERFEAYHWHVQMVDDGNDLEAISQAIKAAQAVTDKPSLIAVRTVIGYGSPKAGTNKVHGEALGPEATKATKKKSGLAGGQELLCAGGGESRTGCRQSTRARSTSRSGTISSPRTRRSIPELAAEFERMQSGKLADGWEKSLPVFPADAKPIATRSAGGEVMDAICQGGARADRRRSRSDHFDQDDFERRRQLPSRSARAAISVSACASLACARR